jgi:hypothetical protein
MHRGLLLFVNLGLFGSITGCSRGVCDCLVNPYYHGTPSPIVKPASAVADPATAPVAAPVQQECKLDTPEQPK